MRDTGLNRRTTTDFLTRSTIRSARAFRLSSSASKPCSRRALGADFEAGVCCGGCNELDDGPIAAQRLAPPVDGDEREEAVFDLVPLAGAWRQMTNRDRKLEPRPG